MMKLALAALVGVLTSVGAVSAQYPEPNELQLAKHERNKAVRALDAAMVARRLQREAGVPNQEASAVEEQAWQRLRVATERVLAQCHERTIRATRWPGTNAASRR